MTEDFDPTLWITTAEAAEMTGYTQIHFRQLARRGKLKACKIGRDWFLDKQAILDYVDQMRQLGPEKYDPWRSGARQRHEQAGDEL